MGAGGGRGGARVSEFCLQRISIKKKIKSNRVSEFSLQRIQI